jgi:hypothetical protein
MSDLTHQKEMRLLKSLQNASGGDALAFKAAFEQLKDRIGPRDGQMAGTIAALLHHTEPDIRLVAALALGKLGNAAAPFVPALNRLACKDDNIPVAGAATCALGMLKTPETLAALIGITESLGKAPRLERIAHHLFSAIKSFGVYGENALPILRRISESIQDRDSAVSFCAKEALQKIQVDIRCRNVEQIDQLCGGEIAPNGSVIEPHSIRTHCHSELAEYREGQFGLLTNRIFAINFNGTQLCRVQIYNRSGGGKVVALIADDHSTPSIQNLSEHFALKLCAHFDLDPKTTLWLEHWDKTYSGDEPKTSQITYKVDAAGILHSPEWRTKKSFAEALRELGVKLGAN